MNKSQFVNGLKKTGSGFLTASALLLDSATNTRIREIDEEIAKLQEERTRLQGTLLRKDS